MRHVVRGKAERPRPHQTDRRSAFGCVPATDQKSALAMTSPGLEQIIADNGDSERNLAEDFASRSGNRAGQHVVDEPEQTHDDKQEAGKTDAGSPERVACETLRDGRKK